MFNIWSFARGGVATRLKEMGEIWQKFAAIPSLLHIFKKFSCNPEFISASTPVNKMQLHQNSTKLQSKDGQIADRCDEKLSDIILGLGWNLSEKENNNLCFSIVFAFDYPIKWFSLSQLQTGVLGECWIWEEHKSTSQFLNPWIYFPSRGEKFQFPLDLTGIEKETKAITFSLEVWKFPCVKALNIYISNFSFHVSRKWACFILTFAPTMHCNALNCNCWLMNHLRK